MKAYRSKYAWMDQCLDANPLILWMVHEDLESLSTSPKGRPAEYTTEILFRALLVHQIEKTAWRETVVRIAESCTLQKFIRLGNRSVMDFTVIASNIHYPTDTSLLWDSYRVLVRLLRAVRKKDATLCPHRFHDKRVKRDLVYVPSFDRAGVRNRRERRPERRNGSGVRPNLQPV